MEQDKKAEKPKDEPEVAQLSDPEEEEETLGWNKHREAQRRPRQDIPS